MSSTALSFLLLLSLAAHAFAKCPCTSPPKGGGGGILPPVPIPTVPLPPLPNVPLPPLPKVPLPPLPNVPLPPLPTVPLPPLPKVPLPPLPTVPLPHVPIVSPVLPPLPVITPVLPPKGGGSGKPSPGSGCPPPPHKSPPPPHKKKKKCPIDTVKLGACLDILGSPIHVGDPAVGCCPLIAGLTSVEAAFCLCTTIKLKVLGVKVFLPIAIELLITCGKTPPPGYSCA